MVSRSILNEDGEEEEFLQQREGEEKKSSDHLLRSHIYLRSRECMRTRECSTTQWGREAVQKVALGKLRNFKDSTMKDYNCIAADCGGIGLRSSPPSLSLSLKGPADFRFVYYRSDDFPGRAMRCEKRV